MHYKAERKLLIYVIFCVFPDVPVGFPKFLRSPKSQSVDVGKSAQLECEAEGIPELLFLWLKNGIPIRSGQQGTQLLGYGNRYKYDGSYDGSNTG